VKNIADMKQRRQFPFGLTPSRLGRLNTLIVNNIFESTSNQFSGYPGAAEDGCRSARRARWRWRLLDQHPRGLVMKGRSARSRARSATRHPISHRRALLLRYRALLRAAQVARRWSPTRFGRPLQASRSVRPNRNRNIKAKSSRRQLPVRKAFSAR